MPVTRPRSTRKVVIEQEDEWVPDPRTKGGSKRMVCWEDEDDPSDEEERIRVAKKRRMDQQELTINSEEELAAQAKAAWVTVRSRKSQPQSLFHLQTRMADHERHLSRSVHPTIPCSLLPPHLANAPPSKRGSSHDMYATRILSLKPGPQDFSLQESSHDDGEKGGGERVLRVCREEGLCDVLVVVSRWYGGEMLGPVRFQHIENVARMAVREYLDRDEVAEYRQRLCELDRRIAESRKRVYREERYDGLTAEKARRRTLELLQSKRGEGDKVSSPPQEPPAIKT